MGVFDSFYVVIKRAVPFCLENKETRAEKFEQLRATSAAFYTKF